jgi:hypothetical protein
MADHSLKASQRAVQHGFEPSRLQEQLWNLAYERVWPVFRKSLKEAKSPSGSKQRTRPVARRARA